MVSDIALAVEKASAGYQGRQVLHDVSVSIATGECVAIMGRSGAGKSTLLGLLYDQVPHRIALVPQAAALVKTLSVFHNVYMGRLDRHSTAYNLQNLVWPRANYNGRPILIGDEPVSALDSEQGANVLRLLRSRFDTLVLALHDVGLALAHADRIIVLEGGRKIIDEQTSTLTARDLIGHFRGAPV